MYIKREDAIELARKGVLISNSNFGKVCKAINDIPSADVVGVVRCKYCKHRQDDVGMGDHRWCDILNGTTRPNDSCPYGERIESEE